MYSLTTHFIVKFLHFYSLPRTLLFLNFGSLNFFPFVLMRILKSRISLFLISNKLYGKGIKKMPAHEQKKARNIKKRPTFKMKEFPFSFVDISSTLVLIVCIRTRVALVVKV